MRKSGAFESFARTSDDCEESFWSIGMACLAVFESQVSGGFS